MAEYTGKTYTKEDYQKLNTATGQEFGKAGEAAVQGQAQQWRDQGNPVLGTNKPEDIRSLGSQLFDWAKTPAGNAVLGGLGLAGVAAATGLGIKDRMKRPEAAPRVEPYVAPTYDFETTAREVPDRAGLPQPSTPAPQAAAPTPTAPAPAPTGVPAPAPQVAMPGEPQPQMKYGETKINAPTGVPSPIAPPAEVTPAPVAPKPVSELEQLRIEKARFDLEAAKAKEARAAEAHANRLAADAKRNAETVQKSQGKASTSLSNNANALVANVAEGKIKADLVESIGTKPVNNLPIGGTGTPVPNVATPPAGVPPIKPIAPTTPDVLTKEQKGMKNYLVAQYGGGPEGEGAYRKVIDILGEVPAFEKGQGGGLSKEANNTIKEWRKANIEGPKVNLTHDMKKVMKGAGGAAILMALPGFAEAAQRKDVGKMSDIFTDFFVLPFAQSREAGMPKAQEESIIAAKFKEASKLGSPYRSVPPPR